MLNSPHLLFLSPPLFLLQRHPFLGYIAFQRERRGKKGGSWERRPIFNSLFPRKIARQVFTSTHNQSIFLLLFLLLLLLLLLYSDVICKATLHIQLLCYNNTHSLSLSLTHAYVLRLHNTQCSCTSSVR